MERLPLSGLATEPEDSNLFESFAVLQRGTYSSYGSVGCHQAIRAPEFFNLQVLSEGASMAHVSILLLNL